MTTKTKHPRPLAEEFTLRPDGKYNLWQLLPFMEGLSETRHNPIWVIRGVFNKVPKWAWS